MKKNSCKKDDSSHCFSSMLQRMVCGRNLPTNPSPSVPISLKKPGEVTTFSNILSENRPNTSQIQVQGPVQTPAEAKYPSIVARLMGLESMPENNTNNNYESLFRSKSLNSLHFYPDFNPTRASFHRRARTSASYHEQGHNNLLVKIDENVENNGCLESKKPHKGSNGNVKGKKEGSRENVVTLKGNERRISRKNVNNNSKMRYEQRFTNSGSSSGSTSSSVSNRLGINKYNNVGYNMRNNEKRKLNVKKNKDKKVKINGSSVGRNNGASMRKVDYKEEMNFEFQSDATSRSPVSVLDQQHHCHLFDSPSKENERQVASHSVSEEMSAPKSKKKDKTSKKLGHKQKLEVAHYFVGLLAQIYSVVEDHVRDPKWMTKYQRSKAHFTDELCVHFGDEMLDFLLLELMYDLIK